MRSDFNHGQSNDINTQDPAWQPIIDKTCPNDLGVAGVATAALQRRPGAGRVRGARR